MKKVMQEQHRADRTMLPKHKEANGKTDSPEPLQYIEGCDLGWC